MYASALSERDMAEFGRLKNVKMDASRSCAFKDWESGKYGAVLFFSGDVGTNNFGLSTPVKVKYFYLDDDGSVDITPECTYVCDRILVPPLFDRHAGLFVGSRNSSGYISHGSFLISADGDYGKVENFDMYMNELQAYNDALAQVRQSMNVD
ncbi:MAG: hypothetical protein LBJ47_05495 [Tannerella sp.]|nr:hypothetical protein [Tannerella sp.]